MEKLRKDEYIKITREDNKLYIERTFIGYNYHNAPLYNNKGQQIKGYTGYTEKVEYFYKKTLSEFIKDEIKKKLDEIKWDIIRGLEF